MPYFLNKIKDFEKAQVVSSESNKMLICDYNGYFFKRI